ALGAFDGAAWRLSLVDIRQLRAADEDQAAALLGKLLADYEAGLQGQADLAYLRQDMRALVDEDRTALATLRSDLGVAIGQTQALIGQETTARATADTALALIADDLSVRLGTAEGDIDAQAGASSILAGRVEAAEGNITAISTQQTELTAAV